MKYVLVFIFCSLFSLMSFAHQDKAFSFNEDNVEVRIITGFNCQEVDNARIIAKYASLLSKELHFQKSILIDLRHNYYNRSENRYSILKGIESQNTSDDFNQLILQIRQPTFNISSTVNLLESVLLNYNGNNVKTPIKVFTINKESKSYKYFDITEFIKWNDKSNSSEIVKDILQNEFEINIFQRLEKDIEANKNKLKILTKDGNYHIYKDNKRIVTITSLNQIIFEVDGYLFDDLYFIFTDPNHFFYIYSINLFSDKLTVSKTFELSKINCQTPIIKSFKLDYERFLIQRYDNAREGSFDQTNLILLNLYDQNIIGNFENNIDKMFPTINDVNGEPKK